VKEKTIWEIIRSILFPGRNKKIQEIEHTCNCNGNCKEGGCGDDCKCSLGNLLYPSPSSDDDR